MKKFLKAADRRTKWTACMTSFLTGSFCVMALPLLAGAGRAVVQYYRIMVEGKQYGCYQTSEDAAKELNQIRMELAKQQPAPAMTDVSCSIVPVERYVRTSSGTDVQKDLYQVMQKNLEQAVQEAYTIKVNEVMLTVDSEEAVISALESIKNQYDTQNGYAVSLVSDEHENVLVPVFTAREGVDTQGMEAIGFEQDVKIVRGYVNQSEICEPASAAAALTKELETPTVYTVEKGDCLSIIAEKHGMKTIQLMELNQLTDSEYIDVGDELVVTVPQPEISVWYKVRSAYEETYNAEIQYQDNDSWYTGTEKVIQEGTPGRRQVVADIMYSSGKEAGREILEETLLVEAQPTIIERGTSTPPTYIKPLVGGSFSSPFGSRWGRMHKGIDWACSIGTSIRASCAGRVTSAGWVNGYGNCITISHSDGKQTRYAHLSKILVSSGSQVKQGEKIALSGNTGNSTGPHLHFEILVGGTQVNPLKYLE